MILSFDNLPLNNDLLRGIYDYGIINPSSLHFDLIQSFLNKKNIVIEKSFYSLETYESVIIASLQLQGSSLIVVENIKMLEYFSSIFNLINKFTKRSLLKKYNKTKKNDNPIYIITLSQFFNHDIDIEHIFFMSINSIVKKYCDTCEKNLIIFDDNINKYDNYEKYYNNGLNQFELSKLNTNYITFNSNEDKLNGKCIDSIYQNISIEQSVIYLENLNDAEYLCNVLKQKDYPVSCFHENITIEEQFQVVNSFFYGDIRMCICTDKSNLDFIKLLNEMKMNYERITHIIHLYSPKPEKYLLRLPYHMNTTHIFINVKET
jgi:hypothetical protein